MFATALDSKNELGSTVVKCSMQVCGLAGSNPEEFWYILSGQW